MSNIEIRSWQTIQQEVLRRIRAREWKPGELIPNEADLAQEFGCARATVNRALRTVAESGLIDRRRKAGTRVALQPVAKATLDISVIRKEVEGKEQKYGYVLQRRKILVPPATVSEAMGVPPTAELLHLTALHLADDAGYALEDRWINLDVVPTARDEPFSEISSNEWLLTHAPYTHGEIGFSAASATSSEAQHLGCAPKSAVFVIDRLTWDHEASVTKVRIVYAPGHQLRTTL